MLDVESPYERTRTMFSVPLAWVQLFLRGWEVGDFYVHDVDAGTAAWEKRVRFSSRGRGGREDQIDRRAKNIVLTADPSMPAELLRCEQTVVSFEVADDAKSWSLVASAFPFGHPQHPGHLNRVCPCSHGLFISL